MSTLSSPVPSIRNLLLSAMSELPNNHIRSIKRVVRSGQHVLLIDGENRLFTNAIRKGCCYSFGIYGFTASLLEALVKAKVISRDDAKTHLAECELKAKTGDRIRAARQLEDAARDLGVKLTPSQLARVQAAKAEKEAA